MTGLAPLTGLTGIDALREAIRRVNDGEATQAATLLELTEAHVAEVLHARFAAAEAVPLTRGLGASPGAASGRVRFTADDAADAADRGEQVILVRLETSPDDIHGLQVAEGILTVRGGLASHAAVVARGRGIPAVVGADDVELGDGRFVVGGVEVRAGDVISLDGATGEVWVGARVVTDAPVGLVPELQEVLGWADAVRTGRVGVRANADSASDLALARSFGADGVGLCRTEHMFLAEDRLAVMRRMILATSAPDEAEALEELRIMQREEFAALLMAADGLPLTVRLLDPPLHEFLPRELVGDPAWHEHNPMLGTRGVRLGVMKPGLYEMQVRALLDAVAAVPGAQVEVLIPLVVGRDELLLARSWVDDAAGTTDVRLAVGAMVETPRAALLAGELAEVADFLSFGTNDLTQLTFGFSRDDVEARLVPAYLRAGLLSANPFETFDNAGVGALVALAMERARAVRPDIPIGVCGEHGGDQASIAAFVALGVDYVSCSPFRVPMARLAVAQAILGSSPST